MKIIFLALLLGGIPSFAGSTNQVSLLTEDELSGAAISSESGLPSARRSVNPAMYSALLAQDQISRVQLFLKNGPAQSGDLRVVQTAKPDPR